MGWPISVTLLLTNPNDQALNLKGYDCELWLEGKSVAQAAGEEPVNLPPHGQTVARVPILVQLPVVLELLPVPPESGTAATALPGRGGLSPGCGAGRPDKGAFSL